MSIKIALSGGPGGGKTTAADLFRRELGEQVVIVPEAATILFSGGFPRTTHPPSVTAQQTTIFHVQKGMEEVYSTTYPDRVQICDRGTIDGAAYWPKSNKGDFFSILGTSLENELKNYDAVLFFETAAAGHIPVIEGGNPCRNENIEQALALDSELRNLWSQHDNFHIVKQQSSFFSKMTFSIAILSSIVETKKRKLMENQLKLVDS